MSKRITPVFQDTVSPEEQKKLYEVYAEDKKQEERRLKSWKLGQIADIVQNILELWTG